MGDKEASGEEGGVIEGVRDGGFPDDQPYPGASVPDRAGAPSGLSPQAVSSDAAHPSRGLPFKRVAAMVHAIIGQKQGVGYSATVERMKQWQKFGYWDGRGSGKGAKLLYPRDAVERAAIMAILSNIGLPPAAASRVSREYQRHLELHARHRAPTVVCLDGHWSGVFYDAARVAAAVDEAFAQ